MHAIPYTVVSFTYHHLALNNNGDKGSCFNLIVVVSFCFNLDLKQLPPCMWMFTFLYFWMCFSGWCNKFSFTLYWFLHKVKNLKYVVQSHTSRHDYLYKVCVIYMVSVKFYFNHTTELLESSYMQYWTALFLVTSSIKGSDLLETVQDGCFTKYPT